MNVLHTYVCKNIITDGPIVRMWFIGRYQSKAGNLVIFISFLSNELYFLEVAVDLAW